MTKYYSCCSSLILWASLVFALVVATSADFNSDFDILYGDWRANISDNGKLLQLNMDESNGSGVKTKKEFLFGRLDMRIKLIPGISKGTITTYYLTSSTSGEEPFHDEVDYEFLGPASGESYTLSTNVFTNGQGNREQKFNLWFDPRLDFHTYSVLWNHNNILFYVDGKPIRVFKNAEDKGVPYANKKPMYLLSTLWSADWAGKVDWKLAPFIASFRDFQADACEWSQGKSTCPPSSSKWWDQTLDVNGVKELKDIRQKYMTYDYCNDKKRFPKGLPAECSIPL